MRWRAGYCCPLAIPSARSPNVIVDAAFVHDTVFMPDLGTARADFPGGDALQLWSSIQRILQLPRETRLFTGHDYRRDGRMACCESTVAVQKANNLHLRNSEEANLSYSAHSSDSQTAIVQRIESTHRSGVTTAPFTRSPRVSLCPHRLARKTRRHSALPPLNARTWWRRLTADALPPTAVSCCSAQSSANSVSPIRLRR